MKVTSVPYPIRAGIRFLITPFRTPISWLIQHEMLPEWTANYLPHRWAMLPYTLYGNNWKSKYFSSPIDAIGAGIFLRGLHRWESETVPVLVEYLRKSTCFVDVGANCGIYTVIGCAVNPKIKVIALEPVPQIFEALQRNVRENHLENHVTAMQVAVSNVEGVVPFHQSDEPTMGSLNANGYRGYGGTIIEVKTIVLDSLGVKPDLIKIDVEGFEDVVLEGASKILAQDRPYIILEANPDGPHQRVTEILAGHGYEFFHLRPEGLRKAAEIQPDAKELCRNWLCVHPVRPK